ncbi:MAG: type III-B CRISPR module-associated protein Cmr5 [Acidobacteriota bacterium]|nr:type III-B CRISPR module-associated protein Cmr5 [Acidobacteriota bacterium]
MTKQTLEQQRAADALARTMALNAQSDEFKVRYRAYVDRLGVAIVTNGLGQALATERSGAGPSPDKDDERAHQALYDNVQEWLCRQGGVYESEPDLLQAITKHDEARYLVAQAEALAWLNWHKKFCRAAFPKAPTKKPTGEDGRD